MSYEYMAQDDRDAHDGPDPIVIEAHADTAYARDFAVMVEVFRTTLERWHGCHEAWAGGRVAREVGILLSTGEPAPHEQPIAQFADDYGIPATLRCLAKAIEQHQAGVPRVGA
jgi:hypothetical protein